MVFFNLAVVVRTVGSLWEGLDRRREEAAAALGASPVAGVPDRHPARADAGHRVGSERRVPVLRHLVRHRAHARRAALRHGGDRDLPAHHPVPRPARRLRALGAAAGRRLRAAVRRAADPHRARARPRPGRRSGTPPGVRAERDAAVLVDDRPRRCCSSPRRCSALVVRSLRRRRRVEPAELPRPRHDRRRRAAGARCPRRWRTPGGSPSTRRCWRCCSACSSRSWSRVRPPGRRAPCAGHARRGVHAAARRLRGDPRLRVPGHPRPAAARPAQLRRCWCRSRRPWSRCRWWCAPSRRCSARSTPASGRPPRRWAPRRCSVVLTVDLPVVWRPLLAATGFAFAVSLGEFGATSFLARPDRPTLPVVIYQLDLAAGGAELRDGAGRVRRARAADRRR